MAPEWLVKAKFIDIDEFQSCVDAFYQWFFVDQGATKPSSSVSFLKTVSEVGELADSIGKSERTERQEDEWADALFALLHHGLIAGYNTGGAMKRIAVKNYNKFETARVINGMIIKAEDLEGL